MPNVNPDTIKRALRVFKHHRGMLRTTDALKNGIHPRDLYAMVELGLLERLGRGLYRVKGMPPLSNPDLAQVAIRVPRAVVCLISALSFHRLTTQVPHEIHLALKKGDEQPRLAYPPLRLFWFTESAYNAGVETHKTDGIPIKVYTVEKTIADCFKFRNKLGLDVATEALRLYIRRGKIRLEEIERYARIDRVQNVIRPYLEALL